MNCKKYAVIEVNTLPDFLVFATVSSRWKGAKILLDMHEITPEFLMSKYDIGMNHWQVRLACLIEKASVRYADHVITINEPIQELLAGRGLRINRSTVIMNSADQSLFPSSRLRTKASPKADTVGRFVFMYHGTLTHIYGLDIALQAFALARREMPTSEFWILGDGPEKRSLEQLSQKAEVGNDVRFIGRMPPTEIADWIKRSSVGVLSTRQDIFLDYSFSNKVSEYIMMGKPVIASRLKTIRYYFSEDSLAYFEPNSPTALAEKMVALYKDRAAHVRFVDEARKEFEPIRWEVMKERYLNLIRVMAGATES